MVRKLSLLIRFAAGCSPARWLNREHGTSSVVPARVESSGSSTNVDIDICAHNYSASDMATRWDGLPFKLFNGYNYNLGRLDYGGCDSDHQTLRGWTIGLVR